MLSDDAIQHPAPPTVRQANFQNVIISGFIGTSAACVAAFSTTHFQMAWTQKQLNNAPLPQIIRGFFCLAGVKKFFQVTQTSLPMTLRHSVAFIGTTKVVAELLADKNLSSFSTGIIAGGVSAVVETAVTAGASREIVKKLNDSAHRETTGKKLLYQYLKEQSPETKHQLMRAMKYYRRTIQVTLLKNMIANPLTIGCVFYFKGELEKRNPGSQWNPALAGMLGPLVASPCFMPFVVLQTKTFANIDKPIWQNCLTLQREGGTAFLRGGITRPAHKIAYGALVFLFIDKMERVKERHPFGLFSHAAGNTQTISTENEEHSRKFN